MGDPRLSAIVVKPNDPVYQAISGWSFKDEFVHRILTDDIPRRVNFGNAQIYAYADSQKNVAGFDVLDVCADCSQFTGGQLHAYIPLLGVNPKMQGQGFGTLIVDHLVETAAGVVAASGQMHPAVFLDVYEESVPAIGLYAKCRFVTLNGPVVDPMNGKRFFVMAKRVGS
jgi:ribosomal protein S18 acetylase RimI-like enzyme